jgi:hypothetical protein
MVNVCGGMIETGIIATVAGVYKLTMSFLGTEFTINSPATPIDDEIVFPAQDLNEDYKFTGKIIDPNGDPVTTTIDEVVYDCVSFKTGMAYEVNPVTTP